MRFFEVIQEEGHQFVRSTSVEATAALKGLDGRPQREHWRPVQVALVEEDLGVDLLPSDISSLGVVPLVVNATAATELEEFWTKNGELLTLLEKGGACLFAFNSQAVDALDEVASDLVRFKSSGRIMRVRKPAFHPEKLVEIDLFHLPGSPSSLYVSQRFVDAVHRSGLRGVVFEKCWELTVQ